MKSSKSKTLFRISMLASLALLFSTSAFAHERHHHKHRHHVCHKHCSAKNRIRYEQGTYKDEAVNVPMWGAHWYAEANIGLSRTHDKRLVAGLGSVRNSGPGWNVDAGYQFTPIWGLEGGFTKYHDSHYDIQSFNIAHTEHYSVDVAATAQYPLPIIYRLNALGKLGVAYSYARMDTPIGFSADARSVSAYGALGLDYSLTPTVDLVGQWARAWGNHLTGSTDLYSIGIKVALV